jgi:catechol 2,3-dioxygenase-like lactoylglutathione lyase family enzyme
MLTRFDHLTIAARELEPALDRYQQLFGLRASWRGTHSELGTHNALFALGNAWIELVAPQPGAAEAEGLQLWLNEHGEGLQAIAFGTDDAAACSAALRERGIRATPPQPGIAVGGDGSTRHYRTVELSPRQTRGVSIVIVERDAAQRSALSASAAVGADSCDALDHLVVRTADPDAALALYGQGLGIRLALDRVLGTTRMLFFRIGGVTVEIVQDANAQAGDKLQGAAYRARDLDALHARLQAASFDTSEVRDGRKPGTRVMTVRDAPCGVPTLLLRDPSRD